MVGAFAQNLQVKRPRCQRMIRHVVVAWATSFPSELRTDSAFSGSDAASDVEGGLGAGQSDSVDRHCPAEQLADEGLPMVEFPPSLEPRKPAFGDLFEGIKH